MPGPVIGSCGGVGERPCPPITCIVTETEAAVHAYGSDCFEAGKTARDAEVSDLKTQLAALSDNDLSASQQLMAARHDLLAANARADHLQSLLDARDKMAAQVAESGVFDVKPQAVDL